MLSALAGWIYMGVIIFAMGCAFLQLFDFLTEKVSDYRKDSLSLPVGYIGYCGILVTTVYAQVFSLFTKVAGIANIILVFLSVFYIIINNKYYFKAVNRIKDIFWKKEKGIQWSGFLVIAVIVLFAACSAGPAKLIDTDWYHAQTIRWIEEYGCVRGVANLFYALGFNNAQHYFDALFSMKWLFHQSLRISGGFFGLLVFLHGFMRVKEWKQHRSHIADGIGLWEIAYSIIITAFYADPYVDTLPNGLVLFVFAEWFAWLENRDENCEFYDTNGSPRGSFIKWTAFLCILSVFAVVTKTSVAPVILLTACPAAILIHNKRIKEILLYIAFGIAILTPFFITNVITSGYPVYLLSALDFFDVPWKIDSSVLQYSVDNMVAFARMPALPVEEALNMGLRWIPEWFARESVSHRLLYTGVFIFAVYDIVMLAVNLIHKKYDSFWWVWPRLCVYLGLLYWFFTIPQVKYCWAFLILPLAVIPAIYAGKMQLKNRWTVRAVCFVSVCLFLMFTGFYSLRTVSYACKGIKSNLILQQDYENHVFNKVKKNGHVFYTKIDQGDIVCGYYVFPYLDNREELNRLHVGKDLGEGFYFEK